MFAIVIGEKGEYGRRLIKYLEAHIKNDIRIHLFTSPDAFLEVMEDAGCYLLDETFAAVVQQQDEDRYRIIADRTILLCDREEKGAFCKCHAPIRLLEKIDALESCERKPLAVKKEDCVVTAVFSPVYDALLRQETRKFMQRGDLFLGMEDVGNITGSRGNMGDLCYYITLKEKDIVQRIKETAWEEEGVSWIDSPELYYDLLELGEEDYRWFFQQIKQSGLYHAVYVGLGSGIFPHLHLDLLFQRLILIDSQENQRQHAFCYRFEQVMQSDKRRFSGNYERHFREELLYGQD